MDKKRQKIKLYTGKLINVVLLTKVSAFQMGSTDFENQY